MAVVKRDPWGDQQGSFENMTQKAVPVVRKAVGDAVKAVATDIKQQVTGDYPTSPEASLGASGQSQSLSTNQVQDEAKKKQELIIQTRQNLDKINADIKRIRDEKKKTEQEKVQVEQKKKQEKKVKEKKKLQDPFWKKMLKGKTGSKEGNVRAGG